VTFPLFFQYCGFGYIFTTLMIAFFKTEDDDKNKFQFEDQRQIGDSYKCLWQIAKLKNVLKLSAIMISMKFSVGACNGITDLKILQQGLSKEIFALLSYSKTLAKLIIPIIARNLTSGSRPLNVFMKVYPYRMISILAITIFIYFIPKMIQNGINDIFCLSLAIMLFLTEVKV
jgi:MFS transporter, PAT family, solute carrier family 33 (acetyl-CoA transportor), member 1